jgi:hypothetical protein
LDHDRSCHTIPYRLVKKCLAYSKSYGSQSSHSERVGLASLWTAQYSCFDINAEMLSWNLLLPKKLLAMQFGSKRQALEGILAATDHGSEPGTWPGAAQQHGAIIITDGLFYRVWLNLSGVAPQGS